MICHKKLLVLLLFSCAVFYIWSAPYSVPTKDSAEYLFCAKHLSVPHPPGAVSYLLLLKPFMIFGYTGALLLHLILALSVSALFYLIISSTARNKMEQLYSFSITLLISSGFFMHFIMFPETDAMLFLLLSFSVFFLLEKKYHLSAFFFCAAFTISYQFISLIPCFVLYPLLRKKIDLKRLLLITILLLSAFTYLPLRGQSLYSYDPGVSSFRGLLTYLSLSEFKVQKNLSSVSHADFREFLKIYPPGTLFFLLFPLISLIKKDKTSIFFSVSSLLYLIFFFYLARASLQNSVHYFFPFVLLSSCSLIHSGLRNSLILLLFASILCWNPLTDRVYNRALPQQYAEISLSGIRQGIYFTARDCHINYFMYFFPSENFFFINVSDLERNAFREKLEKNLKIRISGNDVPEMVVSIIQQTIQQHRVYFENDPIFDFIPFQSAAQGLRREISGEYVPVLISLKNFPDLDYQGNDEEIHNLLITFTNTFLGEISQLVPQDPEKAVSLLLRIPGGVEKIGSFLKKEFYQAAAMQLQQGRKDNAARFYRALLSYSPDEKEALRILEKVQ